MNLLCLYKSFFFNLQKTGNAVKAVSRLMKTGSHGNLNRSGSTNSSIDDLSLSDSPRSPGLLNNVTEESDRTLPSNSTEYCNNSGNPEELNNRQHSDVKHQLGDNVPENKNLQSSTDQNDNKISNNSSEEISSSTVENAVKFENSKNNIEDIQQNHSSLPRETSSITIQLTSSVSKSKTNGDILSSDNKTAKLPVFTQKMVDCKAFAGDAVRFDVVVTGDPSPEVSWLFEEDPISSDAKYSIETNSSKGTKSLIIRSIEEDDEGEYSCKAYNSCGEVICSAELSVIVM